MRSVFIGEQINWGRRPLPAAQRYLPTPRAWVIDLSTGRNVRGQIDASGGNASFSRGVFERWFLPEGAYLVSRPISWTRNETYHAISECGKLTKTTELEAKAWLNQRHQ